MSSLYLRLSRHSASTLAILIALLWGLAEATLFFIVPDVYLGFVALFDWRNSVRATAVTVGGALLGGAVMYMLAAAFGRAATDLVAHVPLVHPGLVQAVDDQMRAQGLWAFVIGPAQGIPYKIYALQAGLQGQPFVGFLLMTIPARLERILPVALACAAAGAIFRKRVQYHTLLIVVAYALMWAAIYGLYYLRFR
jgi:membrane protein YqaA with SNARE-associated domain